MSEKRRGRRPSGLDCFPADCFWSKNGLPKRYESGIKGNSLRNNTDDGFYNNIYFFKLQAFFSIFSKYSKNIFSNCFQAGLVRGKIYR